MKPIPNDIANLVTAVARLQAMQEAWHKFATLPAMAFNAWLEDELHKAGSSRFLPKVEK